MNPVAYWDCGVHDVPTMTGAAGLLDGRDLVQIAGALGFTLPLRNVLDVGCGTGRIAQHCAGYVGLDIAPAMVAYCKQAGLRAERIDGPADVVRYQGADLITCLSVFTHIAREERQAYLAAFHRVAAELLVDILPGDGSGQIQAWTADPDLFVHDLAAAGYQVIGETDWSWNGYVHHYYRARWA